MLCTRPLMLAFAVCVSTIASPQASAQAQCCGSSSGGWGSYYAPYYGYSSYYGGYAGYYDSYASSYGPSYYGGCDSCGCGSYGCSSCSGGGCSACSGGNCASGNCGVGAPYNPAPKPDNQASPSKRPEDRFEPGTGRTLPEDNNDLPPRKTWESTPKSRTDDRAPRSTPEEEREPASSSAPGGDDLLNAQPPGNDDQRYRPKDVRKPDLTDINSNHNSQTQDVNRPNLGSGSEVIPQREPAPMPQPDLPDPPGVEKDSSDAPADAKSLSLDGKVTSKAVAPKTRLALRPSPETPRIARVRARPGATWVAAPQPSVLAKH
ncbi:MAG: hypothetical protein U0872_11400 [Planctomycetaceae bacterium]